ncbi:MAG: hypothetical protein ABIS51_14190, partial [Sphingomonas sp.]
GLRTSLFDFFWLLAMAAILQGVVPDRTLHFSPAPRPLKSRAPGRGGSADSADHGILTEDQKRGRRE